MKMISVTLDEKHHASQKELERRSPNKTIINLDKLDEVITDILEDAYLDDIGKQKMYEATLAVRPFSSKLTYENESDNENSKLLSNDHVRSVLRKSEVN